MQALAANPLLLSLITLNYEENPTLPQRRAGIYKECIDTLITKWDKERKVNRPRNLTPEHLKLLLEVVAWHFHMQRQHYFPKEELLRVISDVLPAIHISRDQKIQILEEITSTYGLLFKQAEEWYGFLHLTFQEYFVSLHIANEDLSSTLLQRIEDPWWEEAILLSAGASKDASPLLQNLLQKNSKTPLNEDIFHTHLILAGRCLAASFRVDEISLQEDIINRLFGTLMQASYSLTRQQIASTLIEMNKTAVNKRIIELLNNQEIERDIHFTLLDAIAKSTNLSISSALLPLLSDIQITKEMRQRIAITLGQQRNPSVTDELLQLILKPDIDTDIRASIIYSLGMSEEEHIVDKLSDLFTHYPDDWELHIQVIDTISKSGKSSSASRLRSQLPEQNLNQDVRIHIIDALGLLKDLSCIPELLKLLIDASILLEERLCIVNNLSILGKGDASTLNYLHQAYKETQGTTIIHQCIAITLARLDDHSTSDDLLKIIPDPMVHLAIRQMAAIALVKLTDVSIIQQLLKICFDAPMDTIIQKCILDTIGMLDDRSLVPMLIPLISNSNIEPEVRSHIVYALEMLGKQLPISELLPLLSDVNVNTQILQLIIDKLEENDNSSLISELLPLLPSQNIAKNVRKSIANTIGKFANDETTAQALTELLYSSDIKDDIYSTLWKVSHQARVRISIIDGPSGKVPNIHKW